MKLILFDVDGTLLTTGDLSSRTFLQVATEVVDREASLGGCSLSGKTDPQIMRELLLANGLSPATAAQVLGESLAAYQGLYLEGLAQLGARALEGAKDVIGRLAAPQTASPDALGEKSVLLGLLTGNLEGLVAPKLASAGIPAEGFLVGAYGSDHADRNMLPGIAVARAEKLCGAPILPDEVVIVGDTPLDIGCARHFGATSVAVASGDYTYEELEDAGADCVLTSLRAWGQAEREIGCRR